MNSGQLFAFLLGGATMLVAVVLVGAAMLMLWRIRK